MYQYLMIPLVVLILGGILLDSLFMVILGILMLPAMLLLEFIKGNMDSYDATNSAQQTFLSKKISKYYVGKDNLTCIGINEDRNEIVVLSRTNLKEEFKVTTYPFEDLFEVKLVEDEETVTSTSRLSQIGGAMVGAAAFGAVGAIVGGSGGKQHSQKEVRKINLELVFDSIDNPLFSISFMNEDLFMKSYDPKYKEYYSDANKWYKSLTVVLKRNELNRNH